MTPEQSAAYVIAQAAQAIITAIGMHSDNMQRQHCGQAMAFCAGDFEQLIMDSGIHHNAVVALFNASNNQRS
jgi:hypothetical protein